MRRLVERKPEGWWREAIYFRFRGCMWGLGRGRGSRVIWVSREPAYVLCIFVLDEDAWSPLRNSSV
jgi:hypothetical protein